MGFKYTFIHKIDKITIRADDSIYNDDDFIQPTERTKSFTNSKTDTSSETQNIAVKYLLNEKWKKVSKCTDSP